MFEYLGFLYSFDMFFYTKVYKYKTLGICNLFNDVAEDRDSIKKYFLIQELIVIMEQDWSVWHW